MTNALMFNTNKVFFNVSIAVDSSSVIVSLAGFLKHSDDTDNTGVPVFDQGPFASDPASCYAQIIDPNYNDVLFVQSGAHQGEKIIGITSTGVSPDSIEIVFYSIKFSDQITVDNITAYTWESGQIETVNICYPFVDRLEQLDMNVLRSTIVLGLTPESYIQKQILETNGTLVYINDGDIVTRT
jgi:hypothetical protein